MANDDPRDAPINSRVIASHLFNVVDQTTGEERKISELDVHRRADARAKRLNSRDPNVREEAYEQICPGIEKPLIN